MALYTYLASGSRDNTVRVWDPATGESVVLLAIGHIALAVAQLSVDRLIVGLDVGIIVFDLSASVKPRRV